MLLPWSASYKHLSAATFSVFAVLQTSCSLTIKILMRHYCREAAPARDHAMVNFALND